MAQGIAGWPMRSSSVAEFAHALQLVSAELVEIPKDLLDRVSLKELFQAVRASGKDLSFAGTTDFTSLAGLDWEDYRRYLDVQTAMASFLGCRFWRIFLQAKTPEDLGKALTRLQTYSRDCPIPEIVIETHGGYESTLAGFETCLSITPYKFVVDFANIADQTLSRMILAGEVGDRIAYFHMRNCPPYVENDATLVLEQEASVVYPDHMFLWEPKKIEGHEVYTFFSKS